MLTAILSGKAAPGVTTSTWALALAWPDPVLVVDADPAGGDMVAGLLAGRANADRGIVSWSVASRRLPALDAATVLQQHVLVLPEAPHLWLMAGFQSAAQTGGLDSGTWERLSRALERAGSVAGRDVLVDVGRVSDSSCWPVIRSADRVLLTVGRSVRSIHAATNATAMLQSRLGDLASVSLMVVGAGPYEPGAIAREIGVPLAGEIPADRHTAAWLSDGTAAGVWGANRSKLLKAAHSIALQLLASAQPGTAVIGAVR